MEIVARIGDDVQISQNIFYLFAVVKLQPADYDIWNFFAHKFFLEQPRLRVGAIQQGNFVVLKIVANDEPFNFLRDNRRLLHIRFAGEEFNFFARTVFRAEVFRLAVEAVLDNEVGGVQNGLCRTIILLQNDNLCLRIIALESQNVAHIRAAPAVNRLVGVANHADILIFFGKLPRQNVLRKIRVLIFINQNVFKTLLILFQNVGISFKQLNRFKNQVVEIQRVILLQFFLIMFVNRRDARLVRVAVVGNFFAELFGRHKIIFQLGNLDVDSVENIFGKIQFADATLD